MRILARRTPLLLAPLLLAISGGCSDAGGGSPVQAEPTPSAACHPAAVVDLAPGQVLPLTAEQAECFRLAPHAGARYALAGFDARGVESARSGPEQPLAGDPLYTLGDGSAPAAALAPAPATPPGGASAVQTDVTIRRSATSEADPFRRAVPWREGDRFPVARREGGGTATARVVRVFGGRYVFAVVDADAGSHAERFLDDTGEAMDFMLREGIGVLSRVYGAAVPVTSEGSGQLLVLFAAWNPDHGAGGATTWLPPEGDGIYSYLWLNLEVRPGVREHFGMFDFASYRLKVLAHELTHAWQMRWLHETRAAGARREAPCGPVWALEGSADLVALDLVRRYLEIGLTSNWDWDAKLRTENRHVTFALEPADTRGRLARGYFDASSFLRDLQVRLARRGVPQDDALAEVARGAVEGWHGFDALGGRREGLKARIGAVLGAGWDPADAVLLWTLAQALDDATENPELDNPVYHRAGDPDARYSWKPAADEVRLGRSFTRPVQHAAGGSFYLQVEDEGAGGVLSARSTLPGARWMIARSR
ncbi:MAG TPA: hypothetical protein VFX98_13140 [Longimicrobiaceae bacterium]|nr:hypothetical protein [Longimicrobiaceae bacterium]